ncbi:MAG TPA: DUF5666 domain-containing protein [Acidisarcina sp.]
MNIRSLKQLCLVASVCLTLTLSLPALAQDGPPAGGMQGGGMGRGQGVRGVVTAIAGKQITIKNEEGDVYTVTTGDNTHLMKNREAATLIDIHPGDMLFVAGDVNASAKTVGAAFVAIVDAEQVRKMRDDLGKTWISGKITAIEDTRITVLRMDGVSQTIAVDENTSFRKRRDSITMADIKVGDPLSGRGALKDGVFVATELNLSQAGMMGMSRGPGGPGRQGRGQGQGQGNDQGSDQAAPPSQNTPRP